MLGLKDIYGESESVRESRKIIEKIAGSPAKSILIYGETGTGKGLVARIIHNSSSQANQPFIDINCAAIPSELFESELFGHERGSFTGALSSKVGLIEHANGGTLFLDELRELNHTSQAKLLSVLDSQKFRRVGATNDIKVNVRFIGATNRILYQEVQKGNFRDDLYYRLQIVAINLPPLRERDDDCMLLTDRFIQKFNKKYSKKIKGWEPAVTEVFKKYKWPGNVRELENLLERIFILEDSDMILVKHIPPRILREVEGFPQLRRTQKDISGTESSPESDESPEPVEFYEATSKFQKFLIGEALEKNAGSLSKAARQLGLTRHSLRHQMLKLGMR